jgi:hypothetical protein
MDHDRATIFLHIPKTAGSSFHGLLARHYRRAETHNVFGSDMLDTSIRAFCDMPEAERRAIRLLKGHMPFGLHDYLPQGASYIGFLRNPVSRVISQYHYIRSNPNNPKHEAVVGAKMDLETFVRSGVVLGMNDGQVRFLTGSFAARGYGETDDSMLTLAQQHIDDHFTVMGVTELFDESVCLMQQRLGWVRAPFYQTQNVSKTRTRATPPDERALDVIREYNRLDLALYEWVRARLAGQLQLEVGINDRVRRFTRRNRLLNAVRFWQ